MCGITGAIWTKPELAVEESVLARMTDVLAHRGPDGAGAFRSEFQLRPPYEAMPGVALGHRRLSIIDLAGGQQPMANEDGTVWVVFNGEIYNFRQLRRRLEGSGHTFRTQCDTEVLVHLYEDEGTNAFEHLIGMFALAIWDARNRRLVLARDRLGKKPLVYRREAGRMLFASELKSLLQVPGVPREIDAGALDEYLAYQYVPHPRTIFRGIHKLPPAHFAVWQDDHFELQRYWLPQSPVQSRREARSHDEERSTLRKLLEDAVRLRLEADVPLGAFLSGGVDSSLIVALMQKFSPQPVKTFSIGFPVKEYDESPHAKAVAKALGTEHREFQVTPDAVSILPKLVWHYDEPFADSSAVPTWYVSQLTREQVKVALTGDGGDELFGGYLRYRAVDVGGWGDRLPAPLRSLAAAKFWQKLPSGQQRGVMRRAKRFSEALRLDPARRYFQWMSVFTEAQRAALYTDEFVASLPDSDPFTFLGHAWRNSGSSDVVQQAMNADLVTYLPCDILTKVDIASMAHGLECRAPLLDHRVVEFAVSLPRNRKYGWGKGKRILRETFGNLVPAFVWKRKKQGFGVPLDYWFRNELREMTHDVLLSDRATSRGYFQKEGVERLLAEHDRRTLDHSHRLWALLFFELWCREWADC